MSNWGICYHSNQNNPWATRHPDWYKKDDDGNFVSPYDWTDVIAFDYNNPVLRDSMMDALKFWVSETDIDGYRCDFPGMVPVDFWNRVRYELDSIKPVFMLAEDEDNDDLLRKAFDMNYGWKLHHIMNEIAQGKQNSNDIWDYFDWNDSIYPSYSYRMYFTSNHDENSWNGTVQERMGDAAEVMAVLSYTIPGMGMIYNGQEAGLNKRLAFFEKDTISTLLHLPMDRRRKQELGWPASTSSFNDTHGPMRTTIYPFRCRWICSGNYG